MAIKIIKATDHIEIKNIIIVLFGQSGVGKTSLGLSSNKALLLDFDNGFQRAAFRGECVQVRQWNDIANLTVEDLQDFDTIVIDTVGRLLEVMSVQLMNSKPSLMNKFTGGLSLPGYGALSTMFKDFLAKLKSYNKDIVLLSHATEKSIKDEIVVRLDIAGGTKDEVRNIADLMGHVFMSGNSFMLDFNPSDTCPGKNFPNIPRQTIPDLKENKVFLGDLIELAKMKLNAKSEEMIKAEQEFEEALNQICLAETTEDFNKLLTHKLIAGKNGNLMLKNKLLEEAKTNAIEFDRGAKLFVNSSLVAKEINDIPENV